MKRLLAESLPNTEALRTAFCFESTDPQTKREAVAAMRVAFEGAAQRRRREEVEACLSERLQGASLQARRDPEQQRAPRRAPS
jgi:hypothetical protein